MKTLDEVIKALEICTSDRGGCGECPFNDNCKPDDKWDDALWYLKNYKSDMRMYAEMDIGTLNEPLTWDELKTMEGKPVWVEEKYSFNNEWHGRWEVIHSVWDDEWDDDPYLFMSDEEYRHKDDMGERWQAYRKERS